MNTSMSLFRLSEECASLYNAVIDSTDEETGEVDAGLVEAWTALQGDFEEKALAVATVHRNLVVYEGNIDAEIKRLQALKKRVEKGADSVASYLEAAMKKVGTVKIQGVSANISIQKNPPKTVIDDQTLIPDEYLVTKTTVDADKTKIKQAILSGREVPGAHIEQEEKIRIK